jgi:L-fuconolactonase
MTLVDTHCHVGLLKYEPVESLLHLMERSGVEKAVFIQYMGNADNSYLVESMAAHPGKFQSAMIVPPEDDGTLIRSWAEKGIVGIRLPLDSRSQSSDPLAHWKAAADLGLIVSAPSRTSKLLGEDFKQVIDTFPNLQIVIEHLAGVGRGAEAPYTEFKQAVKVAERQNLSIKLPGFGEICEVPLPFDPVPPLADLALEAFGSERVMWGSDYPPVSGREGYANSLSVPLEYFSKLSEDEREWIFGKAALKIWKFGE